MSERVAVVFGVANEFSLAWEIAKSLRSGGYRMALGHLPDAGEKKKIETRVRKLGAEISSPLVFPCDVSRDADIDGSLTRAREELGRVDVIVHSVAFAPFEDITRPTLECSRDGFRIAMDVSVYSLVAMARAGAKVLSPGGSILALSYFGAEKVVPGYNVMGLCKAALEAAVRYLAYDLGERGFRVNAVSAGAVKTLSASAVGDFDKMLALHRALAPARRNTTTAEVAAAAAFLLSDAAAGITGEILHVDGGYNVMGAPDAAGMRALARELGAE